jgi:hypothetical protein
MSWKSWEHVNVSMMLRKYGSFVLIFLAAMSYALPGWYNDMQKLLAALNCTQACLRQVEERRNH